MEFVQAKEENVQELRRLFYKSEQHWGYNESFMEIFDRRFNITEAFVKQNPVYIGIENKAILCCWGIIMTDAGCELEYFYVSSSCLGRGCGKQMWKHLADWCKKHHIGELSFVTSHQAVGFYEKMGAKVDGEQLSSIDGRKIPHLSYRIA